MQKTLSHQIKMWLAFLGLAFLLSACAEQEQTTLLVGNTMGTTYHIKVVPNNRLPDANLLQAEIDLTLEQVNNQMSTYRPKSELSKFNSMPREQSVEVSADTVKVLKESFRLYKLTDGALDITLGPLVNLWGFGPDKRPNRIPTDDMINFAKRQTGIEHVSIQGYKLNKHIPELYVDLSSVAKGFGVDKVAELLDKYQVKGYMVEIGGELRVKGTKPGNKPWRVAVEQPTVDERRVQQVIEPGNMAMATSGDYRNYYEGDGRRYSHLIDPRTGYPINHRLASATVLHPSSMTADGLATAMMVLGTQASLALAHQENLAVMLIEKQNDGFKVYYSDAFKPFIKE
ncbi:FAD:protein FMN transferase [Shewanella gelidii]|nr:FAD:protein FMN transferase [Shewanella gelidii]MCL1097109.1 FAD:protein FMN transferase [Shewanella gelidii]